MKISKKWKALVKKMLVYVDEKNFDAAIKLYEEATQGEYIPQSESELFEQAYQKIVRLKKEWENLNKYQKMDHDVLRKAIFKNKRIDLEALLEFTKRYRASKDDIAFFEHFTLSRAVDNKEKIFFVKTINEVESEFDIKILNRNLNKFFNWKDCTKLYFNELGKIINNMLLKTPSDLQSAGEIIGNIQDYYFGFFPQVDIKILAEGIVNYIHGEKTPKDVGDIILRSTIDEELSD